LVKSEKFFQFLYNTFLSYFTIILDKYLEYNYFIVTENFIKIKLLIIKKMKLLKIINFYSKLVIF